MTKTQPMKRSTVNPVLGLLIALGAIGGVGGLAGAVFLFPSLSSALSCFMRYGGRQEACGARYIPSGAMMPTLQINDRVVIDKLAYQSRPPQRGDIIVFKATPAMKQRKMDGDFIMRVIGLPGEKIEVKNGKVLVNNQPLVEPYIAEPPQDQSRPQVVPANHYFVLGDNRNNSYDSRYWGYVPHNLIIGQASDRYFPPSRSGSLTVKSKN